MFLHFFLPMIVLTIAAPILRSSPLRVVGMPVALESSRFMPEMPKARFHEKLSPGIFIILSFIVSVK